MQIFFDFDGTLIDSRPRLYQLFQRLVPESRLSFDEYWELKRSRHTHADVLTGRFNYDLKAIADFEKVWMEKIEEDEWLELDKPFEGVTAFLGQIRDSHSLFLITARQITEKVYGQIDSFGWTELFNKILVTNQRSEKGKMILSAARVQSSDWMVGDTGKDIQEGKMLGMRTGAVLSGFLSRESLERYGPDVIAENVLHLNFDL